MALSASLFQDKGLWMPVHLMMRFQENWYSLQIVFVASNSVLKPLTVFLFQKNIIKKCFTVYNYILQFHYKSHFNSFSNLFTSPLTTFSLEKSLKSGLEIIPFPPVSRILISFIGISLSSPLECSGYLHNLQCHPLSRDGNITGSIFTLMLWSHIRFCFILFLRTQWHPLELQPERQDSWVQFTPLTGYLTFSKSV